MKATIKHVAKRAGVSTATVSHVINNTRTVSPETKQRIMDAIQELDYRPNLRARSFKTGRCNIIGVIIPDISNIFFATVIEEIESVVSEYGYSLMIANTKETKQRELEMLRHFSTGIVDGLIVASTFEDYGELAGVLPPELPVVFFDRKLENCPHDTITFTDRATILYLMKKLLEEGHQRIGCMAGLARLSTTKERVAAYRSAMAEAIPGYQDTYIRYATTVTDGGYRQAKELLNAGCTAIFVVSNIMTRETLRCILDAGLTPGKDIAVVGYHNEDFLTMDVTCLPLPNRNLGRQTGIQMISRLHDPQAPAVNIELVNGPNTDNQFR